MTQGRSGGSLRRRLPATLAAVRRSGASAALTARVGTRRATAAAIRLARPAGDRAARRPVTDYNAPHYWLDYRAGFVRRGLPGAVLRSLLGRPPAYRDVTRAGVVLSGAAVASVVPLAVRASRLAPGRLPAVLATTALVLSPLTCTLLVQDTGRYDAVGVVGLGVIAAVPGAWSALPLPAGAAVLATTVAVATACEEFLLGVLAPVALGGAGLLARRHAVSPSGALLLAGAVLAPGVLVAAASRSLAAARAEAQAAGVHPPGVMGDAVAAVERSLVENLTFFRLFEPRAVVGALVLWSGLYGLTAALLGRLLAPPPGYGVLVAVFAAVGAVLSALGTDFRRWFGLALLGLVATLALDPKRLQAARGPAASPPPLRAVGEAAALVAAGLAVRALPVYPWGRVREGVALPAA
jgi:hypothetical protein